MIYIYHHDDCLTHDPGPVHPENAGRLNACLAALRSAPFHRQVEYLSAPEGSDEQILLAHSPHMLDLVKATSPEVGRLALDADTVMSSGSLAAARRGVGAACKGVDDLLAGACLHAVCLTRPPGHHATPSRSMGFCIFNHIAIAALHALQTHGLQRVAIVDFDVHHGNGTQDIVDGRPGLFYLSTHESPHYPGSGAPAENRVDNILNVPLRAGTDDQEYREIFASTLIPALNAYQPQLLLVSAGFDAHINDPLANLGLTEATYKWLGQHLRKVANSYADGRLLSVLEGGYNLDVLGPSLVAYIEGTLVTQQAI